MTYSAAMFDGESARSLATRSAPSTQRPAARLAPAAGAHLLEIGGGWGGFAESCCKRGMPRHLDQPVGCADCARARANLARRLGERVEFRIEDYRDVRGQYDGVASIEMFEAVGERYWPAFFSTVRRALKPGAHACLQTITIADERFERYRADERLHPAIHFPGGMLASPSRFAAGCMRRVWRSQNVYRFGHDYAETLQRWLATFDLACRSRCAHKASTNASSAAGGSISRIALQVSPARRPMSRSTRSFAPEAAQP